MPSNLEIQCKTFEKKLCSVLIDQVVLEILIVKVCFQLNVIEITLKTSVHKNSKLSMWIHGTQL